MNQLGTVNVHPDRYSAGRAGNNVAVLHTSEQLPDLNPSDDAEALNRYMTRKGDRYTSRGTVYGSSYSYVIDDDGWWLAVDWTQNRYSYSAPPANQFGIHICFPGQAKKSREQWLQPPHRNRISVCAALLVMLHSKIGLNLDHIGDPQLAIAGATKRMEDGGIVDHHAVSRVWHKTDHTDVGGGFPWDVLDNDIAALMLPTPPGPSTGRYDLPMPVLLPGAKGNEVVKLQNICKFFGWYPYKSDGIWGPMTTQAVEKLQKHLLQYGLPPGRPVAWNWMEYVATEKWYRAIGVPT